MRSPNARSTFSSCFIALALLATSPPPAQALDFDTGNAALEVVIPTVAPIVFQDISPTGGDATLVLRATTLITNAWYDSTAPWHPTAVGVYTRLPRQDPPATNAPLNTALLYASYRVLNSLLPHRAALWDQMMIGVGLDPTNDTMDTTSAIGIGNAAGFGVVQGRQHDGMNQLGDEGDPAYNPQPYSDYTNYVPVNSAFELKFPGRWQPDIQRQGIGLYKIQKFVTPQYALVEPYSYPDPTAFFIPPPIGKSPKAPYQAQADAVLQASADLTEEQKLKAELFDDKIRALGFSAIFAAQGQGLDLLGFIQLDFLTNMAAFDAGIVIWRWKRIYDAVRPFSAIRHVYGEQPVTAWGGPGQGTVNDMPASAWRAYLEEADHPEYPSASTCFCAAHAQAARLFLPGGDALGFPVEWPAGSSRIEPGITPAMDTVLVFPTWSGFVDDCGQSRVWAGVHFQAAVDASAALCDVFGDTAHAYLESLLDGTAPGGACAPPDTGDSFGNLVIANIFPTFVEDYGVDNQLIGSKIVTAPTGGLAARELRTGRSVVVDLARRP